MKRGAVEIPLNIQGPRTTKLFGEGRSPTFPDGVTSLKDMSALIMGSGKPIGTDHPAFTTAPKESRRGLELLANPTETVNKRRRFQRINLEEGQLSIREDVSTEFSSQIAKIKPW